MYRIRCNFLAPKGIPTTLPSPVVFNNLQSFSRRYIKYAQRIDITGVRPWANRWIKDTKSFASHELKAENILDEDRLTEKDDRSLTDFHAKYMADVRWWITKKAVSTMVIKKEANNLFSFPNLSPGFWSSPFVGFFSQLFQRFNVWNPTSLNGYASRMVNLAHKQSKDLNLLEAFRIHPDDFDGTTFFFLIHIWIIHRKYLALGQEHLDTVFWEYIWEFFKEQLENANVTESSFSVGLKEIQHKVLGFCVGLDAAFCSTRPYWSGLVHRVIWQHVYHPKNIPSSEESVHELVVYTLRMYQFVEKLPALAFLKSEFTWLPWIPA